MNLGKLNIFPGGEFARNVAILAGSTAFGQGLSLLSAPLLTRLYTPEAFGISSLFSSVLSLLLVVSMLRFEWAIPLPKDDESATYLLIIAIGILISFTCMVGLGILFEMEHLKEWEQLKPITVYLWLLPVGLIVGGVYQVLNVWVIRFKAFNPLARTKIYQSVAGVCVQLGVGLIRGGPLGLILGGVIAQGAGARSLGKLVWQREESTIRALERKRLLDVALRYSRFSLLSTGSSFLNVAGLQLMPVMVMSYYGSAVLGGIALSQKVVGIPAMLVGTATAQAFWSESSRLIYDHPQELRKLFFRLTKKLMKFSLLVCLLGVLSPFTFGWVFGGQNWESAGMYALYLTPMFVTQFIVGTLSHLGIHGLQHWQLIWDGGRLIVTMGCLWTGNLLGWSAGSSILLFSLAMSVMYGTLYLLNLYALERKIRSLIL